MRELTKNELLHRAIGGLRVFEAFITNMGEEQISDSGCSEFGKNITDLEAVEEQLREEDD